MQRNKRKSVNIFMNEFFHVCDERSIFNDFVVGFIVLVKHFRKFSAYFVDSELSKFRFFENYKTIEVRLDRVPKFGSLNENSLCSIVKKNLTLSILNV